MNDETQLISSALNGDNSSFGVLVTRYQNRLLCCVLGVLNDVEEAEDVVQESFVQAYVKLDTFQQNSRFFTWLYRIAFNNALSRRRRRRGASSLDQARESGAPDPIADVESPDYRILQNENVRRVREAMIRLSDDHRIILDLREMQEMSYEDIAEALDISIGTVRSRLSRARNALKSELESNDTGPSD